MKQVAPKVGCGQNDNLAIYVMLVDSRVSNYLHECHNKNPAWSCSIQRTEVQEQEPNRTRTINYVSRLCAVHCAFQASGDLKKGQGAEEERKGRRGELMSSATSGPACDWSIFPQAKAKARHTLGFARIPD